MSLESAKAFIEKMQKNDDFAQSFFACSEPEARKAFIKEKGYDFTKEELDEVRVGFDEVAGGKCCGHSCEHDIEPSCSNEATCRDSPCLDR